MKGKISEIFLSLQGEGLYLGERQIFVRFFGCNLRCQFCDTKLDYFTEYEPEELLREIKKYGFNFHSVSFTGGEPLLQKDFLKQIVKLTSADNIKNYLETNGTLPDELKDIIDYVDIIAMDLKFPSSTGMKSFWHLHREFLKIASTKAVFLKTVICESTKDVDLQEAIKLIKEVNKNLTLVLQPNSFEDYARIRAKIENFRDICINENVNSCIIPQMHKAIGIK